MNFKFPKLSIFQKLLALIVLLVVAYSCSKLDEVPLEINKTADTRVKDPNKLTEWYDKYHKPSKDNLFSTLKPVWNSVTKKQVDGQIVYEIKLDNSEKIVASLNFSVAKKYERINESALKKKQESSAIRLLLFEDAKTAEILGAVYMNIETENDKSLDKYSYRNQSNLTGSVMYYNLNGTLKEGYIYLNGKVTQNIRTPTKSELFELKKIKKMQKYSYKNLVDFRSSRVSSTNNSTNSSSSCDWYIVDYYWKECSGVPLTCNYEYRSSEYLYLCDGTGNELPIDFIDPGEGGGGGAAIVIDCNYVVNGEAFYNRDCNTCMGGDTGITECPPDFIDDLDDYPCAQNLIRSFPTFKGDVADVINSTFGRSDNLNVFFEADASLIGSYAGMLKRADTLANGTVNFIVGLNPDVLNHASQEFILATLYHEAMHAYLTYRLLTLGPIPFANQYGNVSISSSRVVKGHLTMVNFVDGIKDAILSFNSGFGSTRASAVAKEGILNLNTAEDLINRQEQDTRYVGYQGTKCP